MNQKVEEIRRDFPFFGKTDLAYLDNSATSQRPRAVIEAVDTFYYHRNANPFRGLYDLSVEATEAYEAARERVAGFIHARTAREIVFTRNASESLNLAAFSLGELLLHPAIKMLTDYDKTHDSQLTETLRVFSEKGQNVTQAADALFVHRTTLFRRLQQIREMTGIHLEDQKEMLALQLSFYLLQEH